MKRIILLGSGGAGKSTLARKLGEKLAIHVFHLDQFFWQANWVLRNEEAQITIHEKVLQADTWIIDGNYSATLRRRIEAADTIIFIDRNRWVCIYQVLKRSWHYRGTARPDMQAECREHFDWDFIKWLWCFPKNSKPPIEQALKQLPHSKQLIVLKNKKQIEAFVDSLQ
ncbi:MAG: DNA topology modulation protein [Enterococcus sp.]